MSFKSEGNFELKFLDQGKFEILCEDKGQVEAILNLLRKADFVSEVVPTFDLSEDYPDKINGETSNQEGLIAILEEWHEDLAGQEVSKYTDF